MFMFFHIPVKLILRQVHTWSLILTPFDINISLPSKVHSILQSAIVTGLLAFLVPPLIPNNYLIIQVIIHDLKFKSEKWQEINSL